MRGIKFTAGSSVSSPRVLVNGCQFTISSTQTINYIFASGTNGCYVNQVGLRKSDGTIITLSTSTKGSVFNTDSSVYGSGASGSIELSAGTYTLWVQFNSVYWVSGSKGCQISFNATYNV